MPEENKVLPDEKEVIHAISTEIAKNDDIINYITDNSLEALKNRFGAAEEDASILNEDFNPLNDSKANLKKESDDLRSSPSFKSDKDIIAQPSIRSFGSAESEFDNDAISFNDIDLGTLGNIFDEGEAAKDTNNEDFDTHKKVIFFNENLSDGIKRNTETEVSDIFQPDD